MDEPMQRSTSFNLPVPVEEAWKVLRHLERVAACVPGVTLESVQGDTCSGSVVVEVGSTTVTYRGIARIVETDERARRVVIEGTADESGGTGSARARVTAGLQARGDTTELSMATELALAGSPGQSGRGVPADAADTPIDRFAACLASQLAGRAGVEPLPAGPARAPAAAVPPQPTAAATTRSGSAEPIDLYEVASEPIAKRLLPVAGVLAALVLFVWLLRRRRAIAGV
jgi:carbon monoxide dehydrogenase subunit G